MIESNNPEINVDELMEQIKQEVANRRSQLAQPGISKFNSQELAISPTIDYIRLLLKTTESRAHARTSLPGKFNSLFLGSDKLKNLILKVFNLLFRDQRVINLNLLQTLEEFATLSEKLSTYNQQIETKLAVLETKLVALEAELADLKSDFSSLKESDQQNQRNINYLKNELAQQRHLTATFLQENQKQSLDFSHQTQLDNLLRENAHALDAFYVAFEDKFRGEYSEILERLKIYLPLIESANVGSPDAWILDIGCGRGEWLELLRDSGYTARGLDINRVMLEHCRAKQLEVIELDAIAYLMSLPDASLGAITGFHIIEHLPFEILVRLFDEALRVLRPGGLLIFETPNPENILVGSHTFYLDPTHQNPLPSITVKFLAELRGFTKVSILKLHPYPVEIQFSTEGFERLNDYFYGAQDYAVIGYKS